MVLWVSDCLVLELCLHVSLMKRIEGPLPTGNFLQMDVYASSNRQFSYLDQNDFISTEVGFNVKIHFVLSEHYTM